MRGKRSAVHLTTTHDVRITMDVPSLIVLIRMRLAEELTDEQNRIVRAKLADNALLREALTAKLAPEGDDAAQQPIALADFDELMAFINAL